jgi:iron complex transport system substrate-binding protein
MVASRFAFPGQNRVAHEAAPSLTVAGPRRIRTGFPVRPMTGTQTGQRITMCYRSRSMCTRAFVRAHGRHRSSTLLVVFLLGSVLGPAVATSTVAQNSVPLVLENCGVSTTFARPPARVVTLNQAATEVMLVLGLESRLVGTAYLDDQILPEVADAYRKIPVLAAKYPSREILLATKPDLLYAVYPGAYGPTGVGSRADWQTRGVETYLSPAGCTDKTRPPGVTIETTFAEIRDVARMFGIGERGDSLVASYQRELRMVRERIGTVSRPPRVFWYDAEDPPRVGACCGTPNEILRMVGATNIFADTPGSWTPVSWEAVIARNPDVIVLVNASWSTAAEKRGQLMARKALATIDAIKQNRIVEIDFAYTTTGIRNVAAVRRLAEALYPDRFR